MKRKIERPVVNQCKMFSIIKNESFYCSPHKRGGGSGMYKIINVPLYITS